MTGARVSVSALWRYPVKSFGGVEETEIDVEASGPVGDRRWAVLDPDGGRVAARTVPALLGLTATPVPGGVLLRDRDGATLSVAEPAADAPVVPTTISRRPHLASAEDTASAWISARIGQPLRLAFQRPDQDRSVASDHGGLLGDRLSLADTGPILLVAEESVAQVMTWVDDPSPDWTDPRTAARRFRPNVLVRGGAAFEEDAWARIRVGRTWMRRSELCDRCVMTTIDLTTLRTSKEPIRALARHRRWEGSTWFGVRYVPEVAAGTVASIGVGDGVVVGERG